MSQPTRRWIEGKFNSFREPTVLPFHEILDAGVVQSALAEEGALFNERVFTPLVTTCAF